MMPIIILSNVLAFILALRAKTGDLISWCKSSLTSGSGFVNRKLGKFGIILA